MRVIAMHDHINEAARPQSAEDDEGAELEHPLGRYAWQEHSLLDLGTLEGARRRRSRGRPMQLCWLATTRWHRRPDSGAGGLAEEQRLCGAAGLRSEKREIGRGRGDMPAAAWLLWWWRAAWLERQRIKANLLGRLIDRRT